MHCVSVKSFPISQIRKAMISHGVRENLILLSINCGCPSDITMLFVMRLMEARIFNKIILVVMSYLETLHTVQDF